MNKEKQPLNEFELWRRVQAELLGQEALVTSVNVVPVESAETDLEAV